MKQTRIFCYTGTGNCLAAAKQIGKILDCQMEFITAETLSGLTVECGSVVLVYPSYAYGLPKLVQQFIKKTTWKYQYLALVCTYGSSARGTNAEAVKLFLRKKQAVHFSAGSQSVENFVHLFGHPSKELQEERILKQAENIAKIGEAIQKRETNSIPLFRPYSAFVSFWFRLVKGLFTKFYRVTDVCNGCGICRRVCPTAAIVMHEKKNKKSGSVRKVPRFQGKKCDHCQACMQICPQKAIQFGRIKPDSPRYLHKDISLSELMKRDSLN